MNPLIQFRKSIAVSFIALLLACSAQRAQAVGPAPDGGYPNGKSAEETKAGWTLRWSGFGLNTLYTVTGGANMVPPVPALGFFPRCNTATGSGALTNIGTFTSGNTADGCYALHNDTDGYANTALGDGTLLANTTGYANTAVGSQALQNNTVCCNTAFGSSALQANTSGGGNTAIGYQALQRNTVDAFGDAGYDNTAIGYQALQVNNTGYDNTAIGCQALQNTITYANAGGYSNTGVGSHALQNTTGGSNAALGNYALANSTTGFANTANGSYALYNDQTGFNNTAVGQGTLGNNTTGNDNTAIGYQAGGLIRTANHVICIGTNVLGADVSNTTWIGNVYGVTTQNAKTASVIVAADGQLGTVASSQRFKKDIVTMDKASEAILLLRPVTFHYKNDAEETPQFGLIAEEVANVSPALVLPDKEGKPYSVRYDQVNAMLLNEFLKEHRKMEQLTKGFESKLAEQQKQIEALTAGLQKVSAQLEASKSAPRLVNNP